MNDMLPYGHPVVLIPSLPSPTPEDVYAFQQVQTLWNSGNQLGAIESLRPKANDGQAWAAALMAWLLMQQGTLGIEESITWAVRAAQLGLPAQALHTFNNAIAHLPSNPQLAVRLSELFPWAIPWVGGWDPVGQAWSLLSQGQGELGLQILALPAPTPFVDGTNEAQSRLTEMGQLAQKARQSEATVAQLAEDATFRIQQVQDEVQTSAAQANLLVTAVTSGAASKLFEADAKRNTEESKFSWRVGLGVLAAAAFVAVLPVVLHYLGWGPAYSTIEQIGLHLASTAALASFAGVLLARGRSRDRAAQRARDLSTAMGTMISYSNQITDAVERQRFMTIMGQMVLQAHLTIGAGNGAKADDSAAQMLNIASLLKNMSNSSPAGPS